MSNHKKTQEGGFSKIFAAILVPIAFAIALCIYMFIMGDPSNFHDNDKSKHASNILGMVYKGGFIVPILMTMLIIVVAVSIERFITITAAKGSGSLDSLVKNVQGNLSSNNIDSAIGNCDKNKGTVGNVIRAALEKYRKVVGDSSLPKDQKVLSIQKEVEEATALELPMLERNMVFLSTITSVGTLVALLGTVLGMIRSFQAMANAGAPDAVALSQGISEALINTALGIATSAIAIIAYNYFTSQIDSMTYRIDEAGFSIAQTCAEKG